MLPYLFTYKQISDMYEVPVQSVVDKLLDARALPMAKDMVGDHLFATVEVLAAMGFNPKLTPYLR